MNHDAKKEICSLGLLSKALEKLPTHLFEPQTSECKTFGSLQILASNVVGFVCGVNGVATSTVAGKSALV